MSDKDETPSPVDLDYDLMRAAVIKTTGTEPTEDEIEDLALEEATSDPEFILSEQRAAQGLANFPFDGQTVFNRLDENGTPVVLTDIDLLREVATWFVRRELVFFDVDNLEKPIVKPDIASIIYRRIRSQFPQYKIGPEKLKSLVDALTNNPTADPGLSIPVWDGRTVVKPGTMEKLFFANGMVAINVWRKPKYRTLKPKHPGLGIFDEFLAFIFKNPSEKEVFLDWLSWCLQNEDDKPGWAIFLFSARHGTGKSTLASIVKQLFGEANASEQQGVKPIISRFNKPILLKKLIYAEEVKVAQNSDDGNKLKTLISERQTMAESKGKDIEPVDHRCCFLLTTNHKPIWLEPGDRRFYIINVDHEGYAAGGNQYEEFVELVARVKHTYRSDQAIADLYSALIARKQSDLFNAHSLNVNALATEVMQEINALSPDIVEEMLSEFLTEHNLLFIPVRYASKLVDYFAPRNPNATKYSFDRLGWKKKKFAWGGKGAAWAFYHPDARPERGNIMMAGYQESIEEHINSKLALALSNVGFGIAYEYIRDPVAMLKDDDVPF